MVSNNHIKCFFILLFISHFGFSQLSKTHYIPPLTTSGQNSSAPDDQYMYLSTPSTADITYVIKPIGAPTSSYITGIVSKANSQEVFLDSGDGQLFVQASLTSNVINNKGYIVEASGSIYVSLRMNAGNQAGALVSKGLSALGNTFRIGAYTNESGRTNNSNANLMSFVSVMATEDVTNVNFSDVSNNTEIENFSGSFPFNITLNKGESYIIAMNSYSTAFPTNNKDGLIGCLVTSNKSVVVNCGSANGSFHNGNGRDYGIDQIVDLSKVGTEYIFVKGDGNDGWENVLLVAHIDNTSISINGNAAVANINAGDYYLIEGSEYINGNMYVETSQPVFAYQGIGATTNEANQGMFFVPPLSCEARGNLDNIAQITNIGGTFYDGGITIVTKVGATVNVTSSIAGNINIGTANPVTGNPNYITYKIADLTGNISVQSTDELYCAYFNQNDFASSGSFYSGFPTAPEINFDAQFVTLGNCIPNITLEAANTQNFDSFKWLFDDGSGIGFVDLIATSTQITPTLPGKYKLIGIISCTGEELESIEVPVSICPDDIDNDGIIDNIDIDNDNDGILNCIESKGDVTVNMASINTPQLLFQDSSINNTIASALFSQNNSSGTSSNALTGTNTGNFTSIVQPASSAESTYALSFTEPVNVKFAEDVSITHTNTNGEFFIAKILPVNKNITLINLDNRLLVDTNFDGVFETGITQISGSEIHFKFNPTPSGNTPYEFLANQVNGFSFIHKLTNTTSSSTFRGNFLLTCFKKDTDLDGVYDALDLDSDNDGIPDIIENNGSLITLILIQIQTG